MRLLDGPTLPKGKGGRGRRELGRDWGKGSELLWPSLHGLERWEWKKNEVGSNLAQDGCVKRRRSLPFSFPIAPRNRREKLQINTNKNPNHSVYLMTRTI